MSFCFAAIVDEFLGLLFGQHDNFARHRIMKKKRCTHNQKQSTSNETMFTI